MLHYFFQKNIHVDKTIFLMITHKKGFYKVLGPPPQNILEKSKRVLYIKKIGVIEQKIWCVWRFYTSNRIKMVSKTNFWGNKVVFKKSVHFQNRAF